MASLFPTSVSSNGRYIKDQNGDPWMMHGDAAWSLFADLNLTNAQSYLDDRAARGVNIVIANLIEHFISTNAPNDIAGNAPFTGTAFQSNLGTAYWAGVDAIISYAATKGITILAVPAYLGFNHGTEGWWSELAAATNAQVQNYGAQLGARYKTATNIIWCVGGDYTPTATEKDRYDHLIQGIQGAGDTHLVTSHQQRFTDGASQYGSFSWLSLNSVYTRADTTSSTVIADAATGYNEATHRPTFLIEGRYEHFTPTPTLFQVRQEQWQVVLVGGLGGHFVGNESVWSFGFNTGISDSDYVWQNHLADQSSVDASYMAAFWNHYQGRWQNIAPDLTDVFLTSGEGSGGTSQAAASYSTDLGFVYKPAATSTALNMAVFTGHTSMRCRWFDPTAGTFTTIGTVAASGSHTFTHPGNNSKGDSDWVLVIDPDLDVTPTNAIGQATAFSTSTAVKPAIGASSATALANVAATTIKPNSGSAAATALPAQINIGAVGPFTRLATATAAANQPAATVSFHAGFSTATATAFAASVLLGAPTFGPFNALVRFREPDTIVSRQHHPLEG